MSEATAFERGRRAGLMWCRDYLNAAAASLEDGALRNSTSHPDVASGMRTARDAMRAARDVVNAKLMEETCTPSSQPSPASATPALPSSG